MNQHIKNALTGGLIVGGGFILVTLIALVIIAPPLFAIGWYLAWWSFEITVIALLLFAIYTS